MPGSDAHRQPGQARPPDVGRIGRYAKVDAHASQRWHRDADRLRCSGQRRLLQHNGPTHAPGRC
ncbi:hypothetical protein Xmlh_06480 [Xanthomonas axonopodis pv. melhusii]|uniref:Uncharacterized protein n=1 Tax=Xanthomonas axonopodis pv. melhusii TaxID=487834 RepID=A0A1T1P9Q9_9XANT|nr:hypothetical protein Xmlh_06480 [Xanthomonas axonopodis pv. melhusii]